MEKNKKKVVVILSGGMDSGTLLYDMFQTYEEVEAISFNYGQRHKKELEYASKACAKLGVPHKIVDITCINELIQGSSLTSDIDVPEGHYEEDNMKATVVPNRNMILASMAIGFAVSKEFDAVALGVHSGDHYIYPDCRPEFIKALQDAANIATNFEPVITLEWLRGFIEGEGCFSRGRDWNKLKTKEYWYPTFSISQKDKSVLDLINKQIFKGKARIHVNKLSNCWNLKTDRHECGAVYKLMKGYFRSLEKEKSFLRWEEQFKEKYLENDKFLSEYNHIQILAPYLYGNKETILKRGKELGVDYSLTWTCYAGKEKACGKCGSCQERLAAFKSVGIEDPLEYETREILQKKS